MYSFFLIISIIEIIALHARKPSNSCESEWKKNVNYNVPAERIYYISCVEEEWDYAPSGTNLVSGAPITETSHEAKWLWGNGKDRIGRKYIKSLYREFTDICFTTQKRIPSDEHLGALGPNFRALTGETIKVFYKNMCTFDTSIHPHGVSYDKTSEGAPYLDNDGITTGDVVPANGGNWIYIWHARTDMIDQGTSSKMWLYHSHVSTISDIYGGLFGAIIITKQGMETSATNLKPIDIDKEFVTFFVQYDENRSGLFEKNLAKISEGESVRNDQEFIESNQMHALNGYLWNLDHLIMDQNEMVRWYTCSLGDEVDGPHSPHWHANIVVDSLGDHTDTLVLIPGTTYTVTMITESPGIWLYHCHVFDHIAAGMVTVYTVNERDHNNGNVDDDDECRINKKCENIQDCCSNAKDIGVTCSFKYKGSKFYVNKDKNDMGCCIKTGYTCSNDGECCTRNTLCHKHICTHSRLINSYSSSDTK